MSTQTAGKYQYFTRDDYPAFVQKITQFAHSPEPGVIISPPYNGTVRRIEQLIQDDARTFKHPLIQIDLGSNIEDISGVDTSIKSYGYTDKEKVILFINNCDYCLKSKNTSLLRQIVKWHYEGHRKIIFLFESDITSAYNRELLSSTHFYAQNYYYPLFDSFEATRFLNYLAHTWNMSKLPKGVVREIVSLCGGQMWLLKHALREYFSNPKLDLNKLADLPGTKFRLKLIAQAHSAIEITTMVGRQVDASTDNHLEKLGLMKKGKCTVPLLHNFLQKTIHPNRLVLKNDEIYCNEINLKHSFTPQESVVLRLFIKNRGYKITRDDIADALWGDNAEEQYSVWAIEQLIKRLRVKLTEVGLHDSYIKTFRKTGYGIF